MDWNVKCVEVNNIYTILQIAYYGSVLVSHVCTLGLHTIVS